VKHKEGGEVEPAPKPGKPPKPTQFSPSATVLIMAAKRGTPFLEDCDREKKKS
jgi:hypothetical protein